MSTITAGRDRSTPLPFVCPPWCVVDHTGDQAGDLFHRGANAVISVPEQAAFACEEGGPARMVAHLVLPDLDELPGEPAQITVDTGDLFGPYAELNVEQADQFIRDLKTFTARVQQLRDQLAEQNGDQS